MMERLPNEDPNLLATKPLAEWCRLAVEGKPIERRRAVQALGEADPSQRQAMRALRAALDDENVLVRRQAAESLGRVAPKSRSTIVALARLLRDENENVRAQAAESLRQLGPRAAPALAALTRALRDESKFVRWHAAEAIRTIGEPNSRTAKALEKLLSDEDAEVRSAAARALVVVSPDAVSSIAESLDSDDELVRAGAVQALGEMGDSEQAYQAVVRGLQDPSPLVRAAAVRCLDVFLPVRPQSAQMLRAAMGDSAVEVRRVAVEVAGQLGPDARPFLQDLIGFLEDPDMELRSWSALALAGLGREAVPALLKALSSRRQETAACALHALEDMGPPMVTAADLPSLKKTLRHKDPSIRAWSARAIGSLGAFAKSAVMPLAEAAQDAHAEVQLWAIRALASMGPAAKRALPLLRQLFETTEAELREEVGLAIAAIEGDSGWRHDNLEST